MERPSCHCGNAQLRFVGEFYAMQRVDADNKGVLLGFAEKESGFMRFED